VVDAIGGMLKAHAKRLILSRKALISDASSFMINSLDRKVILEEYTEADINDVKLTFGDAWEQETMKIG
jgi:hypothetical protein